MKKIISILTAIMMISTTVFASVTDEVTELYENSAKLNSVSANIVAETELNRPLEIFDSIPMDEITDDLDIDFRMISESLSEAKEMMEYDICVSEDYKKLQLAASIQYDIPINFNSDFSVSAWTKMGMWMDIDITDETAPVLKAIYKIPFMKKYMVLDMSEYYKENPEQFKFYNADKIKEINDRFVEILTKNADITKKGKEYTLKFTDETAKQYIFDALELAKEMLPEEMYEESGIEEKISQVKDFCDKVTVFGKDGLTVKFKKNSAGYITECETKTHININVYDALTQFSMSTEGLEREKAFIDLTFKATAELKNHNKAVPQLPTLTEENSITEEMHNSEYQSMYKDSTSAPILKNNSIYYPIEDMAVQCGTEFSYDGEMITLKDGENSIAVTTEENEVITENEKVYCLEAVLDKLNITAYSVKYDLKKNSLTFSYIWRIIPETTEEAEDVVAEDKTDFPEWYRFSIERLPYQKNGVAYMPVYEFVKTLYEGEFTFEKSALIYNSNSENAFGIKSFVARKGESYVTVNGEQKQLDYPVEEESGILYIPVSFAKSLKLQATMTARFTDDGQSETDYSFYIIKSEENEYNEYDSFRAYFYVESDRVPHMENGTIYIPAYDLIHTMFIGEVTFTEGGFEYKTDKENIFGIKTFSVYEGDKFITVNGEKKELTHEAVNVDNIIRLPISVVSDLGMEVTNIYVYDGSSRYCVKIKEKEIEATKGNWFMDLSIF